MTRLPIYLDDFQSLLARFDSGQGAILEWIAAAHAQAEITLQPWQTEDAREAIIRRFRKLALRFGCSTDRIAFRNPFLEDFTHTDWDRMRIFQSKLFAAGKPCGERSRFYCEKAMRPLNSSSRMCRPPQRPRVFNLVFLRLLPAGRVSEQFKFASTPSPNIDYCGRSKKSSERKPSQTKSTDPRKGTTAMSIITTRDGTEIYYKDWGTGQPVVFSHGWPLTADAWENQMVFLAANGFRCIAHDRRGHGRSSQPSDGNDMDHYADDLAELLEGLGLTQASLVGHSTGGGEVARYMGRHGAKRIAKVVLVSGVQPLMLKTDLNLGGLPIEVFDKIRASVIADRSQFYQDLTIPFFGANRPGAKLSQGVRDAFWSQGMQGGLKNQLECIKAFSETDFTEDLKAFDIPTLIIHGDDDQIVPIEASAHASAKLIRNSVLKVYPGAPHGLADTHKEDLNADLLAFLRGIGARSVDGTQVALKHVPELMSDKAVASKLST